MNDDQIDSLESIVCEAAHNAQVAYCRFSASVSCDSYTGGDWIYDVENIEMAAQRLLNIGNSRCSLATLLKTDMEVDVHALKVQSEEYCQKINEMLNNCQQ